MSSKFLLQTVALLFLGQLLLGGLGWLLTSVAPWAGLPVLPCLVWLIRRIGAVFREEMELALRRGEPIEPRRLAISAALLAQLPGLALLPWWAPAWILTLWQGAVLPVAATLGLFLPAGGEVAREWLWLAAFLEMALFIREATAFRRQPDQPSAPLKVAAGEWAPARRHTDVVKRGLRVR